MATVAVVTGLVASAVVLSALLVLCAMRRKVCFIEYSCGRVKLNSCKFLLHQYYRKIPTSEAAHLKKSIN